MNKEFGAVGSTVEVADKLAIQEVIAAHCWGLDRLDSTQIKACYWDDATVDYGAFKGAAHEFAEIIIPALSGQYQLTQHSLSNSLVQLRGDSARVESHVTARHLQLAGEEELAYFGRYLDSLEKRDGQWRMTHRQVVMDWSRREAVSDERNAPAFKELAKGGQSDDPLYSFLNRN